MSGELPILAFGDLITKTVWSSPVTIIAAETGAGKSTRVPLMLLQMELGKRGLIGVTEPRRIAAQSLARYVAELHGSGLGETIGYQIRNDKRMSSVTQVKFMTEGILLRELHSDPELRRYEVVIVDEAHERGVNQDLILALLKRVRRRRPSLKVVIMSATIDEERFSKYFDGAPIVKVPGRVFPVEVHYAGETPESTKQMVEVCVAKVAEIAGSGEAGDILVFLPDEVMIREVCGELKQEKALETVLILPLYGNQPPEEQQQVFSPLPIRRIIVATNIAETSITVPGVVHVVDSGLIKAVKYVSASMSALQVIEHSRAGCDQRKGRAGRTQPGICHRLFTRESYDERPAYTDPEIRRMALDQILLHLRSLGHSMEDVIGLEFPDPPGDARWQEADARLKLLGALGADGNVTEEGRRMERLPVAPMLARMLLAAERYGCVEPMARIVAGLAARPVFVRPHGMGEQANEKHRAFKQSWGDAMTLLRVWRTWEEQSKENGARSAWAREHFCSSRALREIERNSEQLLAILKEAGVEATRTDDPNTICKAVAAGLIVNLCVKCGRYNYAWQGRSDIFVFPGSALFGFGPQMMVCSAVVETTKAFARDCTAIEAEWLEELVPVHAREKVWRFEITYEGKPRVVEQEAWQGTVIAEREAEEFPAEAEPALVERLAEEIEGRVVDLFTPFHSQSSGNKASWRRILQSQGVTMLPWSREWMGVEERLGGQLRSFLAERVRGVRTLEEVRRRDIRLRLEDWLLRAAAEQRY